MKKVLLYVLEVWEGFVKNFNYTSNKELFSSKFLLVYFLFLFFFIIFFGPSKHFCFILLFYSLREFRDTKFALLINIELPILTLWHLYYSKIILFPLNCKVKRHVIRWPNLKTKLFVKNSENNFLSIIAKAMVEGINQHKSIINYLKG